MAVAIIRPQTVVHDILIATVSYKQVFNSTRVRSNMPQLDVTVYASEAEGEFIGGIERLTIDLGGILKKGAAYTGPLIPLPQGVAFTIQWDTTCTIIGTCNFSEGEVSRPAGAVGTITGQAFSTGTFMVNWVLS